MAMTEEFPEPSLNLQLMTSAVSEAFQLFHNCNSVRMETRNVIIMRAINGIKEQESKFYDAARRSINRVEALKSHSQDVLDYINLLQSPECTFEKKLASLNSLFGDAKANKENWMSLKESFERITNSLSDQNRVLINHEYDLPNKKRERMSKIRDLDALKESVFIKNSVTAGSVVLSLILFVIGTVPSLNQLHLIALLILAIGIPIFCSARSDKATIHQVQEKLDEINDILDNGIENIGELRDIIDPIKKCMLENEVFWETEENRVSHLIRNLQNSRSNRTASTFAIEVSPLVNKWCDVQMQCETYKNIISRLLLADLQR